VEGIHRHGQWCEAEQEGEIREGEIQLGVYSVGLPEQIPEVREASDREVHRAK